MEPLAGDHLSTGQAVLIHLDSRLSGLYSEPQARIFTADHAREIVFQRRPPPYELYGYHPENPGRTPIPFWGDHYIKPARDGSEPNTPWAWIKREVNQSIFLPSVGATPLPAQLHWTRVQKLPKFICSQYHNHLVTAYEAVWALIAAMRKLSDHGRVLPSRWKLAASDLVAIHERALQLSRHVDHPLYRSRPFLSQVLRLEVLGLAPHFEPVHEKLKQISAEMFEIVVAEFIRARLNYEVLWSYYPPFLKGEVDIYARGEARNALTVLLVSCKFRTTNTPRPVSWDEIDKLAIRLGEATKHERVQGQNRGIHASNVTVSAALFSNARAIEPKAAELAAKRGIAVVQVNMPDKFRENPTGREGIQPKDVSTLLAGGEPVTKILAELQSN